VDRDPVTFSRGERPVLVLVERSIEVRAKLDPTAWIVLEELARCASPDDDLYVAEVSARAIAESLGRSRDAVTRALRQLVDLGLVERGESRVAHSGRFTRGSYVVDLRAAGLRLPAAPVVAPTTPPARPTASVRPDLPPPPAHRSPQRDCHDLRNPPWP